VNLWEFKTYERSATRAREFFLFSRLENLLHELRCCGVLGDGAKILVVAAAASVSNLLNILTHAQFFENLCRSKE
jgi:hypothetical protein